MRIISILSAVIALSASAFAQLVEVPTFTITTNDIVQSSIKVFRVGDTNGAKATVKFAYTDIGAKRFEEFYRAHSDSNEFRYQAGRFERVSLLEQRKFFGRDGFLELPEQEARLLEDGLRGRK